VVFLALLSSGPTSPDEAEETGRIREMSKAEDLRGSAIGDPWKVETDGSFVSPMNDKHDGEVHIFDEMMSDGSIEVAITPLNGLPQANDKEPKVGLAVFRFVDPRNYYFAGIGAWGAKLCIGRMADGQSRQLAGSGDSASLEKNHTYNIKIEFSGSRFVLSENGVRQVSTIDNAYSTGNWGFRTWKTEARFANARSDPRKPMCFLIMPFAGFEEVYRVLKETVEKHGFRCERADTSFITKPIIDDIMMFISKADLIIVDLSGKNPNVFYEAGVATALKKKVIHIAQSTDDLTFDVKHLRTFIYEFDFGGDRRLVENLDKAIKETMSSLPAP
jgi:hypothetical protein